MVVIESLSVGTPVLVSEHVGLAKYVQDRRLGWVTGMEVEEVRRNLRMAWLAREERRRIRRDAVEIIRQVF